MKKILALFVSAFIFCNSCFKNETIHDKFNTLKNEDYSIFDNMRIIERKGIYFVTYKGSTHKIERNFFTKKISNVERAFSKETSVLLSEKDINHLNYVLKSFDKLKVMILLVDEKGNVFLTIPWYDKCTYDFLKLSPVSTLKELKEEYYKNYEDNWYLDKSCGTTR